MDSRLIIKIAVFMACSTTSLTCAAQNKIVYTYDKNGNRTVRSIPTTKAKTQSKLCSTQATESKLTVNIPRNADLSQCVITLCDMSGNILMEKRPELYSETLSIQNLKKGVYIMNVDMDGETESHKFVKR